MGAIRDKRHLIVPKEPAVEPYRPPKRRVLPRPLPGPEDRLTHAAALRTSLQKAEQEALEQRAALGLTVHGAQPGIYVQFESLPGIDLNVKSLEDRRQRIEVVAVQTVKSGSDGDPVQRATVFIPDGKLKHFFTRFEQYATEQTSKGEPRHKDMVDRIADVRRAALRELWTDAVTAYPREHETIWWEVWLRVHDGHEVERLCEFARVVGLHMGEQRLVFDDRIVVLVRATPEQLSGSIDVLNDVAEVRRAKESAAFFVDMSRQDQLAWAEDFSRRITRPPTDAPAVCILDTGVASGHPLLQPVIDQSGVTSVDPTWGGHDDGGGPGRMGHGTEMAGLAAYGDLTPLLSGSALVRVHHRLESVKILPPRGDNHPNLYGAITAQAVSRAEILAPDRRRVFSLAVTANDQRDRGQPTSWSAAIDALAAGRIFDR
ncbi:MAG: S8 family peptidase [Firmicutes bacterium]|nr:S8 family peptidase [Bacillota bacterium]